MVKDSSIYQNLSPYTTWKVIFSVVTIDAVLQEKLKHMVVD